MNEIGTWASIVAAVFAVLAVVVPLVLRLWDSQSHIDIDYRLGSGEEMPYAWLVALQAPTPTEQVAMFRVENVGARTELLSDAYIRVPGGSTLRQFEGGNPPLPSQLQPGFPRVFCVDLRDFSRNLVNKGCTDTARVDLVIRLGRGDVHTKRIEIPDVEAEAKG